MTIAGMLTTPDDFVAYNGGSGIYRSTAVQQALVFAEGEVGSWLSTGLVPTTYTDEFDWPVDQDRMYLRKVRLISITSAEGLYSNGQCTYQSPTESICTTILDAKNSIFRLMDPWRRWCSGSRCPERMRITYFAGFTSAESDPNTIDGMTLRGAIFNAALGFLETATSLQAQGNLFISGFQAAGYNESRQLPDMSGAVNIKNQHILMAKEMIRRLAVKRTIMFRSRGTVGRAC